MKAGASTSAKRFGNALAFACAFALATPALAEDAPTLTLTGEYAIDLVSVPHGPGSGTRHVDLISLTAELDLEAAAGWPGARLVAQGIAGTGRQPNLIAGTLQGIDNNEVSDNRVKLFEAYLEQRLPGLPVTLKAGFIDLNADFYANESAGLLMAPAFGVGSELAATGPNGPSLFPSTALTATVRFEPGATSYAQFAVVNAEAGVLGDRGGVRPLYGQGALIVGEAGITAFGKIAGGAWAYTRRQDDTRLTDAAGEPVKQKARGAYALFEVPLASDGAGGDKAAFFLRAGLSDGDTTPYRGGWQAGVLVNRLFAGLPDSQVSLGINQALLSDKFRRNEAEAGNPQRRAETALELTLSDRVAPWLTIQPDAQYVWNSARGPGSRDAVVFAIRFTFSHVQAW